MAEAAWSPVGAGSQGVAGYERPRVERVLTVAELEREVQYAGQDEPTLPVDT